jgi:TolB-like protein/Tfp pilus assembly protein PilF
MTKKKSRLLAAIMFTDMVGYTALMQKDEQKAKENRDRHRKILQNSVTNHQGKILQYYGDGTLIIFNSAIEGVDCAIQIQKELQRDPKIPSRIGIHTGDIVYDDEGVYGDGVNVASRIEGLAVSGSVLISGKVFDEVKNHKAFLTVHLGTFALKNVHKPLEVYAITNEGLAVPNEKEIKAKPGDKKKSLAVLPFVNMSSDPENEYFSDGITEEIINALAHIESLKVIARTSAFAYKDKYKDVRKIGKELNVETILEGSVRKAGNTLRITAQLIQVSDGAHIWSERYDRVMKDIFNIQDEISLAITDKLKIELFDDERMKLLKSKTHNLEAYKLYLQGRFYWNKRTREGLTRSIEYFKKSIETDPDYALAYIGLADAYIVLGDWGHMLPKDAFRNAKDIVLKALKIDETLGEAYATLGYISGFYEWNWKEAENYFQRAFELNQNYPTAHQWYALSCAILGLVNRAHNHISQAKELDPLSMVLNVANGIIYYFSHDFNKAIKQFQKALAINRNLGSVYFWLGIIYIQNRMHDEAVREFKNMISIDRQDSSTQKYVSQVEDTYKKSGIEGVINWLIDEGDSLDKEIYNRPFRQAVYNTILGDKEKAMEWLEQAVEMQSPRITAMSFDPVLDPLRNDPRFTKALERMGLVESL